MSGGWLTRDRVQVRLQLSFKGHQRGGSADPREEMGRAGRDPKLSYKEADLWIFCRFCHSVVLKTRTV